MNRYTTLFESDDYRGEHQAPENDGFSAPLYDVTLTDIYPDDFYSIEGYRYYGAGESFDSEVISLIHSYQNKPNKVITVYRAVPNPNKKIEQKIKELKKGIGYFNKNGRFPHTDFKGYDYFHVVKDPEFEAFQDADYNYDTYQQRVIDLCEQEIKNLTSLKSNHKYKINSGDWVTLNRKYAVAHGRQSLNDEYKVIYTKVKAKELFTDGNSIHEWGYSK